MESLKGKVAIVTGASTGIGHAVAELYVQHGTKVVLADINEEAGKALEKELTQKGGEVLFVKTNVGIAADCKNMVEKTIEKYGRLDYACNNAGISGEINKTEYYSIENWQQVMDVNLSGVFYCMKYQLPHMKENGGSIINMSSILGEVGFAGSSAYVATKHALNGLTKTTANEYGTYGVRVNAVGPAFIKTPLLDQLDKDMLNSLAEMHPVKRLGKPEEVAHLVMWLSSDQASFVTGSYYPVDGGYLTQ